MTRLGGAFAHVETATYACGGAAHVIATLRHASGVELQLLPGGSFTRGAKEELKNDHAVQWWSAAQARRRGTSGETTRTPRGASASAPRRRSRCRRPRTRFGLLAMLGTVREWVADQPVCTYRWRPDMSHTDPAGDPGEDHYRIARGGSWSSDFTACRSTSFSFFPSFEEQDPADRVDVGVRVAVTLDRDYSPTGRYRVGERIVHSKFGPGVVKAVAGKKLEAQFAEGPRTLVHAG